MEIKNVKSLLLTCLIGGAVFQSNAAPRFLTQFLRGLRTGVSTGAILAGIRYLAAGYQPAFAAIAESDAPVDPVQAQNMLFEQISPLLREYKFAQARGTVLNSSYTSEIKEHFLSIVDDAETQSDTMEFEYSDGACSSASCVADSRVLKISDCVEQEKKNIAVKIRKGGPVAVLANFLLHQKSDREQKWSAEQARQLYEFILEQIEQKVLAVQDEPCAVQDVILGLKKLQAELIVRNDELHADRIMRLVQDIEYKIAEHNARRCDEIWEKLTAEFDVLKARAQTSEELVNVAMFRDFADEIEQVSNLLPKEKIEDVRRLCIRLQDESILENITQRKVLLDRLYEQALGLYREYSRIMGHDILTTKTNVVEKTDEVRAALQRVIDVTPVDHEYNQRMTYYLHQMQKK